MEATHQKSQRPRRRSQPLQVIWSNFNHDKLPPLVLFTNFVIKKGNLFSLLWQVADWDAFISPHIFPWLAMAKS